MSKHNDGGAAMSDLLKMNPEAQRIAIAEACGWTECHAATKTPHGFFEAYGRKKLLCGSRKHERLPDYLNDLNAMHEAENILQHYGVFVDQLAKIMGQPRQSIMLVNATAAQRAEAFLRTLGKWEEGTK